MPAPPKLKVASRAQVDPFIVMDVFAAANARAAAGADVLHMEVGEPGSGPPAAVLAAARKALGRIPLGYTEALGRPRLRAAIAGHYDQQYGLGVDPGQVVVTVGASGAFVLAFLTAFDVGDRVVVPEPAFPAYKNALRALGIEVVRLGVDHESAFKPTVAKLEALEGPQLDRPHQVRRRHQQPSRQPVMQKYFEKPLTTIASRSWSPPPRR